MGKPQDKISGGDTYIIAVGVDDDGQLRCVTAVGSLAPHERRAVAQRLRTLADEIDGPPRAEILH